MEPLRTSKDDCRININSKYNYIIHSSRVLSIPLIRCDDQVFNGNIKEEIIDETDHHNYSQLLQIRTKTEKESTIHTEIKAEVDFIDSYGFEGTVSNESNSSEFITTMNSTLTSNCLKKNPLASNCDEMCTLSNLTMHPRIHTVEKLYKCDFCDTGFSRASQLTEHTRTHTGEKPFKCDTCDKKFSKARQLTSHKRTHTGIKPHKCEICCARFSRLYSLTMHKTIHTGERPYKCNICYTRFSRLYSLTMHKTIHTGKKLYKCDICYTRFSRLYSLTRHKITHTGEKPYECDICGRAFSQKSYVKSHKRNKHILKKTV